MIFVTVGTNEARFDRLLRAVAALPGDEPLLVQHGHSTPFPRPGAELVEFLSFEEMREAVGRARAVVTHAGVGSIMVALGGGKRPVVVPRSGALGEAVDDHQLQLGRRFARAGLVTLVEEPAELAAALARPQEGAALATGGSSLAADLGDFLARAIPARAASAA